MDAGEKFADLKLLEVEQGDDHEIVVYTMDKGDTQLVKKTFSKLLKYCLQTTSLRSSATRDALGKKIRD